VPLAGWRAGAGAALGVGAAAGDDDPGRTAGIVLPGDGDEEAATAMVTPEPDWSRCR
jgi:hypothetical protein